VGDEPLVAVHHRDAPDRARSLADQLAQRLPDGTEIIVSELDAVLGAHVGPGAVGVVVASAATGASGTSED
ncbi:DegV family protein, partial [Rhodococcus sp. R1101]